MPRLLNVGPSGQSAADPEHKRLYDAICALEKYPTDGTVELLISEPIIQNGKPCLKVGLRREGEDKSVWRRWSHFSDVKADGFEQIIQIQLLRHDLTPWQRLKLEQALQPPPGLTRSPGGLYTFTELKNRKELAKPKAVIQGLIYRGEMVLLAGRLKVGKTRLIHQAALAIATGGEFLGMPVPEPLRVLIVDLENQPWALRDRLMRMSSDAADVKNLYVWCTNSLAGGIDSTIEGQKKLKDLVEQVEPDVLVIDPWRVFLHGDENSAVDALNGLRALAGLREGRSSLTIIVLHHCRKDKFETTHTVLKDPRLWTAENISGHSALPGHVDSILGLDREQDGEGDEVMVFGGAWRNGEPPTLILEESAQSLLFEVRRGDDILSKILTPKEIEIWKVATTFKGTFGFGDVVEKSKAPSRARVDSMLKKMLAHGRVERVTGGKYDRWKISGRGGGQ